MKNYNHLFNQTENYEEVLTRVMIKRAFRYAPSLQTMLQRVLAKRYQRRIEAAGGKLRPTIHQSEGKRVTT